MTLSADPREPERKLKAIIEASAGDLSTPDYPQTLVQEARQAGATPDQVGAAIEANVYWPEPAPR